LTVTAIWLCFRLSMVLPFAQSWWSMVLSSMSIFSLISLAIYVKFLWYWNLTLTSKKLTPNHLPFSSPRHRQLVSQLCSPIDCPQVFKRHHGSMCLAESNFRWHWRRIGRWWHRS
jgi:hypothetical protein